MFNENQESRILQNDTDSAFFTMQGTVLQDVMVHSPEAFPKAFANFLVILRNRLNENLRTSQGSFSKISVADLLEHEVEPDRDQGFLMMECEEIVVSNFTSFAKKSYARCDAIAMKRKGQKDVPFSVHLAETMKMITENGKMDLELMKKAQREKRISKIMIKGVQWSKFHEYFRDQIRDLFLEILVGRDASEVKMTFKERMLREFKIALDNLDHVVMERFATRIKRTGKNGKAVALQNKYPDITDNYVHVLPLKRLAGAKQMAGDLIIPVEKIHKGNVRNIDLSQILKEFESQWTKFFVAERSQVRADRNEIMQQMANNEVMIRVETARNPQAMHAAMTPEETGSFVLAHQDKCCHEVISRPFTKLFFDIDESLTATRKFDLVRFERAVIQRLEDNGFDAKDLQMFVSQREDTRKKISMHIAFDIVMPLEISKRIAIAMKSQFPAIDIQLYAVGKSLRVNGSKKIGDPSSVITSRWSLKETLVTFVEGFRVVEEPIALSTVPVINFSTKIDKVFVTGNEPAEFLEIAANLILKPETANDYFKKASLRVGTTCPACDQIHDSDDDWKLTLYQTQKDYVIRCFRDRATGGESIHRVPLSKEQKKARRDAAKEKDIDVTTQFEFCRFVPTQDSQHVDFQLLNSPLVVVKAQMGSGKTHRMIELLKSFVPERTTVMLSVRQTLSSSWAQRYAVAGLKIADYRDTIGQIVPKVGVIHVVQVDSLQRLSPGHIDLLVLDEVESVMAQLNSSQLRDATAVKLKFMDLCKRSEQLIALDGQLQESTVAMLEKLTGNSAEITWNNKKTYDGYNAVIRRFGRKGTDHMINAFLTAVAEGKKVVGHINSLSILEQISAAVRQRFPEKNVVAYHGENNRVEKGEDGSSRYHFQRKRQDLENVEVSFKQADVLLWTGTITCGVDFNEDHFDLNISCFSNNCNTMQAFAQGLFRVRKLADKKMIIYVEKCDAEFTASPKDIFEEWAENSSRFDVAGEHLNSDLFNFQIWSLAFERAIAGRPQAYLVATLNQLGISIVAENLSKEQERARDIAKDLDLNATGRISAAMIMEAQPVNRFAVDYWLERNEARAQEMLEKNEVDEHLSGNLKTIGFIATIANKKMEDKGLLGHDSKFKDETHQQFCERKDKIVIEMNDILKQVQAMPKDSVADMVVQFTCYATYKHNFAGIVGHVENGIGRLALDQVKHAVEISVKNNQKQYLRGQKLKETAQAEVSLSKRAAQIIDAKMFLDAFLAGDMDQAKIHAKSFGQPETKNWKHIIAALGLHMNTTEAKRTKVMGPDGKWKNGSRQFKVVMHTFFAPNDIVGQVDGFQFKS